jgi:hypothetical protein
MRISDPRWIAIVRDQISAVVREFNIDAVHLDSGSIVTRAWQPMHEALREALPQTLFGAEFVCELGHSFFHLTQGGSLPKESPHRFSDLSWRLIQPYTKVYWHLCHPPVFVPSVSVCNRDPVVKELPDADKANAQRQWNQAPRYHILPNFRMNYRDFGLDPRTREAFAQALGNASP